VDAETLKTVATAATMVGDFATAAEVLSRAAAQLRVQGRLGLLAQALTSLVWAQIQCGRMLEATAVADEAVRLCHETAQWWWKTGAITAQALLLGIRGGSDEVEELIAQSEAETPRHSSSPLMWAEIQLARGLTALAAGEPDRALGMLRRMFDPGDRAYGPSTRWWGVTELVEAAYRAGRVEEVRGWTDLLVVDAARTGSPVLVTAAAFVAPLVADGERAGAAFAAAVADGFDGNEHLSGRMALLHGEWLQQRRRPAEAREHLAAAVAAFDRIGATRWRDTALRGPVGTGGRSTAPAPPRDLLDPRELRIARLVAAGMTDREIAEDLYLSVRAVGALVARIRSALGTATRAELARALEP
jgi:DNA-binding CsgD family transcriptional regulator